MTCIKTGARVHFTNYGCTVSADIFQVADAVVVRTMRNPNNLPSQPVSKATHELTAPPIGRNEFWRDDLGVFVVPSQYLKVL